MIDGCRNLKYEQRLKKLNITTLEESRDVPELGFLNPAGTG